MTAQDRRSERLGWQDLSYAQGMRLFESARDRYPEEQRGRCVTCGFLAKHRADSDLWHEVSLDNRKRGHTYKGGYGHQNEINTLPSCFVHAFDLLAELGGDTPMEFDKVLAIIERDRDCPEWYPYTPGYSPQGHREELRMMQLEQERKDFQARFAEIEAQSRASLERIEKDSLEIARATASFTTKWTYVAVALATLAVLAGGVAAVFTALSYLAPHVAPK